MKFLFASKVVELVNDNSLAGDILKQELSLYPPVNNNEKVDLFIHMNKKSEDSDVVSSNPKIHKELEDGMTVDFPRCSITWFNDKKNVVFNYKRDNKNTRYKLRNMQFTHPYQEIGQVFHELVLIPTLMLFYSDELALIHGSALKRDENNAVIFGGTGGVGKTSLELELINNHNFSFLADDISILDKNGFIWPNLAFPKIYGYNTINDKELENKVLAQRGLFDKLWWKFRKSYYSADKVRRRVNPQDFYEGKVGGKEKLESMNILFRKKCDSIQKKDNINEEVISMMNIEVLKSEYAIVFNHLFWHKYNHLNEGNVIFDSEEILNNWYNIQLNLFKNINCSIIEVPINYSAIETREGIAKLIVE